MNTISFEEQGEVGVITMSHAAKNSVTLEFSEQFLAAIEKAENSSCKALVITGTGDSFCAGMNLKEVPFYNNQQQTRLLQHANKNIYKLYRFTKPVVAAVNGHAIGAGLVLALVTDYRVVSSSESVSYGLTEARSGIPFPACPAVALSAEMAPQDVRFLTLYSKNVKATALKEMRIADELVGRNEVLNRAMVVARDMATIPADSYSAVKIQFRLEAIEKMKEIVENNIDPMLKKWVSDNGALAADTVLNESPVV